MSRRFARGSGLIGSGPSTSPFERDRATAETPLLTSFLPKPYPDLMTALLQFPTLAIGCIHRRTRAMPADEPRRELPVEWAFVVHLRPGGFPEEGRMAGRVEHFTSGRCQQFGSLVELLAFLGRVAKDLREDVEHGEGPSGKAR
jgi:hypothetical protein